jgi:hypothetical protein
MATGGPLKTAAKTGSAEKTAKRKGRNEEGDNSAGDA